MECVKSAEVFQEKLRSIQLPEGFELVVEPWPYGGPDEADGQTRLFQALCFGRDTRSGNPDSNFYAYPLPFIPIVDARKMEVIRIDQPATGGKGDQLSGVSHKKEILEHCQTAEYVPELIPGGTRTDVKPLTVLQPEGASFTVSESNLIEWQKWRFRVTFNPREGAVLHDIRYDGRSVLYRLSISDMVSMKAYYDGGDHIADYFRPFRMPTQEHLFIESRHSTLVMADWEIVSTTLLWDVIVLVLSR